MVNYNHAQSEADLQAILTLQKENLPGNISEAEALEQGFLTVVHEADILRDMNLPYGHTVARDGEQIVGYALTMTEAFKERIPVLVPFFKRVRSLSWNNNPVTDYRYVLMGQVCVAKPYRGKGVFKGLYRKMQERMAPHFDLILTEISERNTRSMRAHEKVGFREMTRFAAPDNERWVVVGLEC